jgi:serine/threonine-protein kinase
MMLHPLVPGDMILDRYRVVAKLATGGHSITYRGSDERLSRPVCIKVFLTLGVGTQAWRSAYDHFVQEAFTLSRLSHPNTLRIYDFGHLGDPDDSSEGAPFQVFEYLDGGTLSQRIRRDGPLGPEETGIIVTSLAGALAEAHQFGVVHRDIKPSNILFGHGGPNRQPKLADFGIAKVLVDEVLGRRAITYPGVGGRQMLMFSPAWAAPEQIQGQPVGPTTDIYSLALVTIYMLTGSVVFRSPDVMDALEKRHRSDLLIEADLAGSRVPQPVISLLKQACSFDTRRRPQEAMSFAEVLVQALQDSVRRATRSVSPPRRSSHWPRTFQRLRHPKASVLPSVLPRRISMCHDAQPIGDRFGYFVPVPDGGTVVECAGGVARIRVSLIRIGNRTYVHVKGMNCFISLNDGRPTAATQLGSPGRFDLVAPNRDVLARARVLFATRTEDYLTFQVADQAVAVDMVDCPYAVALDFGPGAECLFIYSPPIDGAGEAAPSPTRSMN